MPKVNFLDVAPSGWVESPHEGYAPQQVDMDRQMAGYYDQIGQNRQQVPMPSYVPIPTPQRQFTNTGYNQPSYVDPSMMRHMANSYMNSHNANNFALAQLQADLGRMRPQMMGDRFNRRVFNPLAAGLMSMFGDSKEAQKFADNTDKRLAKNEDLYFRAMNSLGLARDRQAGQAFDFMREYDTSSPKAQRQMRQTNAYENQVKDSIQRGNYDRQYKEANRKSKYEEKRSQYYKDRAKELETFIGMQQKNIREDRMQQGEERRQEQGDRRIEQGAQRLVQGDRRLDNSANAEVGRNKRHAEDLAWKIQKVMDDRSYKSDAERQRALNNLVKQQYGAQVKADPNAPIPTDKVGRTNTPQETQKIEDYKRYARNYFRIKYGGKLPQGKSMAELNKEIRDAYNIDG